MAYTFTTFTDWITNLIGNVAFFQTGTNFIFALFVVFVTAILISPRKIANIKTLALPLMIGYSLIGLHIPMLFMVFAGILFIMDTLTLKGIGETIKAVSTATETILDSRINPLSYTTKEKARREEEHLSKMEKLKGIEKRKHELQLWKDNWDNESILSKKEYKKGLKEREESLKKWQKDYRKKRFDERTLGEKRQKEALNDVSFRTGLRGVGNNKYQGAGVGDTLTYGQATQLQRARQNEIARKLEKQRQKNIARAERKTISGKAKDLINAREQYRKILKVKDKVTRDRLLKNFFKERKDKLPFWGVDE